MYIWLIFILICISIAGSIWLRMRRSRANKENIFENNQSILFHEAKQSPLSNAVQELIATAGGIYLALIMTVSFLKLNIPQTVSLEMFKNFLSQNNQTDLAELTFDPLALISVSLAVIEPAAIKVKNIIINIIKSR